MLVRTAAALFGPILAPVLAAILIVASPSAAQAQQILDSYTAFIGPQDLFNSRGQRLTSAAAVIRQDRANYHRFGLIDPEDTGDTFFGDARNRELLEAWVRNGRVDRYVSDLVLAGGALIHVQVWGWGDRGDYVSVIVY